MAISHIIDLHAELANASIHIGAAPDATFHRSIFAAGWLWFVAHKEPVLNFSDLISFVMVTPELTTELSERSPIRLIAFYLPIALFVGAIGLLIYAIIDIPYVRWATVIIVPLGLIGVFAAAVSTWVVRMLGGAGAPDAEMDTFLASKYLLYGGVLLFVISRLLGVAAGIFGEA